jgi:hypothetical protein
MRERTSLDKSIYIDRHPYEAIVRFGPLVTG